MKLKTILIVTLHLVSIISNAQTIQDKIDSFIENTLNEFSEIPSLAITIVKDDKAFFTNAYGYSDIENKVKTNTNTVYYIASVTKSFVGLLASQLEADGVIDLDKPITEYAPIKNFEDNLVFQGVTIKDLLSHTSGIRNGFFTWRYASIGDYTNDDMIKLLEEKTVSLKNNKSYRYDNFGYNVFDLILSQEFNLNWKEELEKRIFKPLNFKNTSALYLKAQNSQWKLAQPYTAINENRLPNLALTQKNEQTFQAAGGMVMSIEDAQKWLLFNINKGKLEGEQMYSENILNKSHTSIADTNQKGDIFQDVGYGLGYKNGLFRNEKVIYHLGGFDGYFAHMSFMPEKKFGIAVFANESHFGDNVSNLIASFVYDLLLGNVSSISDYDDEIEKVKQRIANIQASFDADRTNRSDRKWTLMHDFDKYEGKYENKYAGLMQVKMYDKTLKINLGISTSFASPSTKDDSVRVEFRDGQGTDILFISNEKEVLALVYGGNVYLKK
ncbi:MAG: serine hydrolase domain-containing protein [Bacteroidota bacterium]